MKNYQKTQRYTEVLYIIQMAVIMWEKLRKNNVMVEGSSLIKREES